VTERGAIEARQLVSGTLATSRLSEIEVASALSRRRREGLCTDRERDAALSDLATDLGEMRVVELASDVVATARRVLQRHALRAGDAIHLASCLRLQQEAGDPVPFVAFDERLRAAAARDGLVVLPARQSTS
jgi:predicted nucleic acid-binding protein